MGIAFGFLFGVVASWFLVVPVWSVLLGAFIPGMRPHLIAAAYWMRMPLFRYVTRRDERCEKYVGAIAVLMGAPAAMVPMPAVRRVSSRIPIHLLGVCYHDCKLLLFSGVVEGYTDAQCFWLVGHEMGHYLDTALDRQGHPLFDIIREEERERFADAVAWYCLEYLLAVSDDRSFDWQDFTQKLPCLLEASSRMPMPVTRPIRGGKR